MVDAAKLPRNEELAQWVARAVHHAGGVDVVISDLGWRNPISMRTKSWVIIAGAREPAGHRHIVAVTDDWTVMTFAPGTTDKVWVETAAHLDVVAARVIDCVNWLRDDPARDSIADRVLRAFVAVNERFPQHRPGRAWTLSINGPREGWITLLVDGHQTPACFALQEGKGEGSGALDAVLDTLGRQLAHVDAFESDAAALRVFVGSLLQRLQKGAPAGGKGWSSRDNFAYYAFNDVARAHVYGVRDGVEVHVASVVARAGSFAVDVFGVEFVGGLVDDKLVNAVNAGLVDARGRVSQATLRPNTRVRLKLDVKGFTAGTDAVFVDTVQVGRDEFALRFKVGDNAWLSIDLDTGADDELLRELHRYFDLV